MSWGLYELGKVGEQLKQPVLDVSLQNAPMLSHIVGVHTSEDSYAFPPIDVYLNTDTCR